MATSIGDRQEEEESGSSFVSCSFHRTYTFNRRKR